MKPAAKRATENALDALGSPVRRKILTILAQEAQPVGSLARHLPVSRPAVSKHLRILQGANLVAFERQGTRNVFRLEPVGFQAARAWLDTYWDSALARFVLLAENTADPGADNS